MVLMNEVAKVLKMAVGLQLKWINKTKNPVKRQDFSVSCR